MAQISIWGADDFEIPSASGLGFFGDAGFGQPVPLRSFPGHTFVVTPNGQNQGFEINNCKLYGGGSFSGIAGVSGVIVGQSSNGILLRNLPNYLATLNLRFTHTSAVLVQNALFAVHDGVNESNDPSGLIAYCAEIIHPDELQTTLGDGDETWIPVHGSASILGLSDSPGISGLYTNVALHADTRHDWYVAISPSPSSPNDKSFGYTFSLEYL